MRLIITLSYLILSYGCISCPGPTYLVHELNVGTVCFYCVIHTLSKVLFLRNDTGKSSVLAQAQWELIVYLGSYHPDIRGIDLDCYLGAKISQLPQSQKRGT